YGQADDAAGNAIPYPFPDCRDLIVKKARPSTKGLRSNSAEWEDGPMSPTGNRLRLRPHTRVAKRATIASGVAASAFAVFLTVPWSTPRASTDCASLGVELQDSAEFNKVECDEGSFQHGDLFGSFEDISASNSHSVYAIRHEIAGNRTYI